jgi:hypothetical protein
MHLRSFFLLIAAGLVPGIGAHAQTLPLGTVSNLQTVACPAGFTPGSNCQHLMIHACPRVSDVGVTIGILAGKLGTIVLFTGATGTRPTGGAFANDYHRAGYTVIDTDWDQGGWENTGNTPNLLAASCRGATLLNFLSTISTAPFCAQGTSAGSSEVAYAMAWYGLDTRLTNVELLSGPVMSDLNQGCEVPNVRPVTVIPTNGAPFSNAPQYVDQFIATVTRFTGQNCQPATPTPSTASSSWLAQSIVQPTTPKLAFTTSISGWLCDNGLNNSAAQGAIFYSALGSNHSLTRVNGCSGSEGVAQGVTPQGINGLAAIEQDMKLHCVARR